MLITQKEKKEYELAPEGMIAAVCVDVIDIGEAMGVQPDDLGRYCVPSKNKSWQPKPRARLVFELETKMQDGRPFTISADFPARTGADWPDCQAEGQSGQLGGGTTYRGQYRPEGAFTGQRGYFED